MSKRIEVHHPILDRIPKEALDTLALLNHYAVIARHVSGGDYLVKNYLLAKRVVPEEAVRFLEADGLITPLGTERRIAQWGITWRGEQVRLLRFWIGWRDALPANTLRQMPPWIVVIVVEYVDRKVRALVKLLRADEESATPNVATPEQHEAETDQGGHDED